MNTEAKTEISIAAETMVGELMAITLDELKLAPKPWGQRGKKDQDDALDRIETRVKDAVKQVVSLISTKGFAAIPASLESVTIKDGIKAVLSVGRFSPDRHELTDAQGKSVIVVLAETEQFLGSHEHKAQEDQLALDLDKSGNAPPAGEDSDSDDE